MPAGVKSNAKMANEEKRKFILKKKEYESEISRKAKGYEKVEAVGREVKEKGS